VLEELFHRRADVADNLAKKKRRDVTSAVKRHGRAPTINVTKLLVGPSLPDLLEAHTVQDPDDFARAEDR
jgi:hypothetical protein